MTSASALAAARSEGGAIKGFFEGFRVWGLGFRA